MKARIAVIAGDGIGPEVITEALRVLEAVCRRHGHEFALEQLPFGGTAIDQFGDPLPPATLTICAGASRRPPAVTCTLDTSMVMGALMFQTMSLITRPPP